MSLEIQKPTEQELALRLRTLVHASRLFLNEYYRVRGFVYFGAVLAEVNPQTTDFIVIARPEFTLQSERIDKIMKDLFNKADENTKVHLPPPNTLDVIIVRRFQDPVILKPYNLDYGYFAVLRDKVYFERLANKTSSKQPRTSV